MTSRCVAGPKNSCTIWAETQDGSLYQHVRIHPQGGLQEQCDPDCGNDVGLALCLVGQPEPEDPTDPTESGLRISQDGCLWVKTSTGRKTRTLSSVTQGGIQTSTTILNGTIPIDATNETVETCWEICVDVCSSFVDCPDGGNATVSIPPTTINVPDTGGQVTVALGSSTVTDPPKVTVVGQVTIDTKTCDVYAASNNQFDTWSGRVCHEVTIQPGAITNVPIQFGVDVRGSIQSGGFLAGSGEHKITARKVECAEVC